MREEQDGVECGELQFIVEAGRWEGRGGGYEGKSAATRSRHEAALEAKQRCARFSPLV
jgi:hypothetical protein